MSNTRSYIIRATESTEKATVSSNLLDSRKKQVNNVLYIFTIFLLISLSVLPTKKNGNTTATAEHHDPFVENTRLGLQRHKTRESDYIIFHKVGRAGPQGHIPSHLAAILP